MAVEDESNNEDLELQVLCVQMSRQGCHRRLTVKAGDGRADWYGSFDCIVFVSFFTPKLSDLIIIITEGKRY